MTGEHVTGKMSHAYLFSSTVNGKRRDMSRLQADARGLAITNTQNWRLSDQGDFTTVGQLIGKNPVSCFIRWVYLECMAARELWFPPELEVSPHPRQHGSLAWPLWPISFLLKLPSVCSWKRQPWSLQGSCSAQGNISDGEAPQASFFVFTTSFVANRSRKKTHTPDALTNVPRRGWITNVAILVPSTLFML